MASGREDSAATSKRLIETDKIGPESQAGARKQQHQRVHTKLEDRQATYCSSIDSGCGGGGGGVAATITTNLNHNHCTETDDNGDLSCDCLASSAALRERHGHFRSRNIHEQAKSSSAAAMEPSRSGQAGQLKMLVLSRQQQREGLSKSTVAGGDGGQPEAAAVAAPSSVSSSSSSGAKSASEQCRIALSKSTREQGHDNDHDHDHDPDLEHEHEHNLAGPGASVQMKHLREQEQLQRQLSALAHKLTPHSSGGGGGGEGLGQVLAGKQRPTLKPIKARENWDKNIEFLLAVIGFAVDLGNVWRFPYICYKNGGGAFLIPYTIMFIFGGLPIFYLEMSLGQLFSSGCLTVWRRVCPLAKGIGYAMCVLNFFTGLFYNTVISWAVFFFVESFTSQLPWTSCNNTWNSPDCTTISERQLARGNSSLSSFASSSPLATMRLNGSQAAPAQPRVAFSSPTKDYFEREVLHVHLSSGIDDLGAIRTPLAVYLAIVFICIYFAIWKGVKSTGKAVWITALLPYFVLIPLLIRGVFLEGAWLGIRYYLYPDWIKIGNVDVWVEAAKQIYFSLGPGFGTLMALSSYNRFDHNCERDALIAASVNYFASFISGLVIFAVLGYMATFENVSIEEVATEGPGLVFQVYPEGLATMRFSAMWSVLFFMMVITLGIDSTFGGLESVITGLCDEYPRSLRAHRGIFIGLLIIIIYLCSLPTTTYGGNYVIFLIESYGTALSLLFIVLCEIIVVCWIYGTDRFCSDLKRMSGKRPGAYWRICWKYISPTLSLLIFAAACIQEWDKYHTLSNGEYTFPSWAPTVGLLMTGASVCCVPIYAIYYVQTKTRGSFLERLKAGCTPIEANQDLEEHDRYTDAVLVDKIRDHNDAHLDTDI